MTGSDGSLDRLYADMLGAGEDVPRLRAVLARHAPDEPVMLALLRRPLPLRLLELLGTQPPWNDDVRVLAGVVLNPRTPAALAQRLLPALLWRDLAEAAFSPRVNGAVHVRAEAVLRDRLPELRLGDRVSLARIATPRVLAALLADTDRKVLDACLFNPRLREEDVLLALRQDGVGRALLEALSESPRWSDNYNVRLGLVLQPRTPLALALSQIRFLRRRDLRRVAETDGLIPLLQAAALRVAGERDEDWPET